MSWEEAVSDLREGERLGIDIGSRSTKYCTGEHLGIMDTAAFLYSFLWDKIPSGMETVATGYGRKKIPFGRTVPEIRAHTLGALESTGIDTMTLLDIGGQDFKVVRVDKKAIRDFHMNDKCAAGTGRFLEKMTDVLGMDIKTLGSAEGGRKILESTCSVFTETELISLMMEGVSREELAGGVVHSVFERVRPYLRMFPLDRIVFTGGVSACSGLRRTLEAELEVEVIVPENAQYMGALGCFLVRSKGS